MVHVGQAATSAYGLAAEGGALPGEPPGHAEREARKLLERQVKEVRAAGGPVTESHLRMGKPAREIVGLSEKLGVDLLVVGSGRAHAARHALSATARRAALGSAADYIVRSATAPSW
jgi:nucleotide-binding universal stress UspA family protein